MKIGCCFLVAESYVYYYFHMYYYVFALLIHSVLKRYPFHAFRGIAVRCLMQVPKFVEAQIKGMRPRKCIYVCSFFMSAGP